MRSDTYTPRPTRSLHGFTLLELVVVVTILGILSFLAVPAYLQSQRNQRLITATQQLGGAITALRNMALTGREIGGDLPDGYCFRVIDETHVDAVSYTDTNADGYFTAGDAFTTLSAGTIALPDFDGLLKGVSISSVLLKQTGLAATWTLTSPELCFSPPRASVTFSRSSSTPGIIPASYGTLSYELSTNDPLSVLRVEVDRMTGAIRSTTTLGATERDPVNPRTDP